MKIIQFFLFVLAMCFSQETSHAMPPPPYKAKEMFVTVDGAQLFCRVMGQGSPIVVVHGGPGLSQDYLLPQMERLAKKNLVIFYDQRACGRSTGKVDESSIQIDTFIQDLEAIRKFFNFTKMTVLGHSLGGFLAIQYALTHPESIDRLVLLNTAPISSEEFSLFVQEVHHRLTLHQDELKSIEKSEEFALGDPATAEKYYRIFFRAYCYNPQKADLINLRMTPLSFINGTKLDEIFWKTIFLKPFDFYDQLDQITIPTLIVHGDFDPVPSTSAQKIHEKIRGSTYVLLQNCGHMPYVEKPLELFKHLNDFLEQNPN